MRYRRVGPIALATALALLPGATSGQMGPGKGRVMDHRATPFYLEPLFLLLVAVAGATWDGSFMTFGSVGSPIRTALALLAELRERPPDLAPAPPLSVRAGIAYGEILLDGRGTRHGAVINKAFRLEGLQREALVHVEEDAMGPEIPEDKYQILEEAGRPGPATAAHGDA